MVGGAVVVDVFSMDADDGDCQPPVAEGWLRDQLPVWWVYSA